MKLPPSRSILLNGKIKSPVLSRRLEYLKRRFTSIFRRSRFVGLFSQMGLLGQKSQDFLRDIKAIGITKTMDDLERRKLSIFNQLNFFQLITGVIIPISFFFTNKDLP